MTTSRPAKLLGILQRFFNAREEAWIWLAMYDDDREEGVVSVFEGEYEDPARTASGLAYVINELPVDHAYVALCRTEGRPTEADRELWRGLRSQLKDATLVDMVVFNRDAAWSMRAEDAAAAAAQNDPLAS
jgi:hypothetical protein